MKRNFLIETVRDAWKEFTNAATTAFKERITEVCKRHRKHGALNVANLRHAIISETGFDVSEMQLFDDGRLEVSLIVSVTIPNVVERTDA